MIQTECVKLRRGDREKVIGMTGVDYRTLYQGMKFERNGLKARKARIYAVNFLNCNIYIDKRHLI